VSEMPRDSVPQLESDAEDGTGENTLEQLVALVDANPASPVFPALAATYRLMGQLDEARRVAEAGLEAAPETAGGRVVLALTLLDLGQVDGARQQLNRGLRSLQVTPAAQPAETPLEDVEIDRAFESAEARPDEMLDTSKVVEETLRREELDRPEGGLSSLPPSFATRTMADLLENQGDAIEAERIRASLGDDALESELDAAQVPADVESDVASAGLRDGLQRGAIITTLETWLDNLRRGVA
jgi:hypothetical protein